MHRPNAGSANSSMVVEAETSAEVLEPVREPTAVEPLERDDRDGVPTKHPPGTVWLDAPRVMRVGKTYDVPVIVECGECGVFSESPRPPRSTTGRAPRRHCRQ